MNISKTTDGHIHILKRGVILRLTQAEAFEALAWLYQHRDELYQSAQHPLIEAVQAANSTDRARLLVLFCTENEHHSAWIFSEEMALHKRRPVRIGPYHQQIALSEAIETLFPGLPRVQVESADFWGFVDGVLSLE